MKHVQIKTVINLQEDHCKYGTDLDDFLLRVKGLQDFKGDFTKMVEVANKFKIHPILQNLDIYPVIYTTEQKSEYTLVIDGEEQEPVIDSQIWMHTLVQELITLLEEN